MRGKVQTFGGFLKLLMGKTCSLSFFLTLALLVHVKEKQANSGESTYIFWNRMMSCYTWFELYF